MSETEQKQWELAKGYTAVITAPDVEWDKKSLAAGNLKGLGSSAVDGVASTLLAYAEDNKGGEPTRMLIVSVLRAASPWVAIDGMARVRKTMKSRNNKQTVNRFIATRKSTIGQRFLAVMTGDASTSDEKRWAVAGLKDSREIKLAKKQQLVAPLVPELVAYAELVSRAKRPDASSVRSAIFHAIKIAPREVAVEEMIKVKNCETDREERKRLQEEITAVRRSLNATKHRRSRQSQAATSALVA